jgi:hypothetical protein
MLIVLLIIIDIKHFIHLKYFLIVLINSFYFSFEIIKMHIMFIKFIIFIFVFFIHVDLIISLYKYHMHVIYLPLILNNHYIQHLHIHDNDVDEMLL